MSAQEVWAHLQTKGPELLAIRIDQQNRVLKKLKKLPPRQFGGESTPYYYKPLNQNLLLVTCKGDQKGAGGSTVLAVAPYKYGKLLYCYTGWSKGRLMEVYTSHFFKRYQERTHSRHSYPTIVAQFLARTLSTTLLYLDEENLRAVYACRDGIILCTVDIEKQLAYYRTFVSAEMLKNTQREAYEIYLKYLPQLLHDTNKRHSKEYYSTEEYHEVLNHAPDYDIIGKAGKIYAQYWEEDDNTD